MNVFVPSSSSVPAPAFVIPMPLIFAEMSRSGPTSDMAAAVVKVSLGVISERVPVPSTFEPVVPQPLRVGLRFAEREFRRVADEHFSARHVENTDVRPPRSRSAE